MTEDDDDGINLSDYIFAGAILTLMIIFIAGPIIYLNVTMG